MGKLRLVVVAIAAIAFLSISSRAEANLLFQSAQNVISGSIGTDLSGVETDSTFYSGANFMVTTPVHVSQIGGNFGNEIALGNNQIFGVIVPVANLNASPNPADLSSNVLASTLITLPNANVTADVSGAVSLDLAPGYYGVVFGSGKFGASGETIAAESLNGLPANTAGTQSYALRASDGTMFTQAPGARYFVEGNVPEPASAATLTFAAAFLAGARRRARGSDAH